jgi:hypothetical protein
MSMSIDVTQELLKNQPLLGKHVMSPKPLVIDFASRGTILGGLEGEASAVTQRATGRYRRLCSNAV